VPQPSFIEKLTLPFKEGKCQEKDFFVNIAEKLKQHLQQEVNGKLIELIIIDNLTPLFNILSENNKNIIYSLFSELYATLILFSGEPQSNIKSTLFINFTCSPYDEMLLKIINLIEN
jgi:hypothetical protein